MSVNETEVAKNTQPLIEKHKKEDLIMCKICETNRERRLYGATNDEVMIIGIGDGRNWKKVYVDRKPEIDINMLVIETYVETPGGSKMVSSEKVYITHCPYCGEEL